MSNRLDDLPVYEYKKSEVAGHYYNHVSLALKRLDKQIRLSIPGLKHLDLILDNEAWIIIDTVHAEFPIAAWSDFETEGRTDLAAPVKCVIRTYHAAADLILERTLDAMEQIIDERLLEKYDDQQDKVIDLHRRK